VDEVRADNLLWEGEDEVKSIAPLRIGVLASAGQTLDAFFIEIFDVWERFGSIVFPAAGTPSSHPGTSLIAGLTREPSLRNVITRSSLRNWIDKNEIDVVLTNTATASFLARSKSLSCPVSYFCHGLHWDRMDLMSMPYRYLERLALRNTAGVITINSDDYHWFGSNAPDTPLLRLTMGVGLDPQRYPRSAPIRATETRLLWIGEFSRRKNPMGAVSVAEHLRALKAPFKLSMLGNGPLYGKVRQAVRDRDLGEQVELHGRVPVASHLAKCHVVVHTAAWEGLPRVLLEALAVGRHIYGYDVKGVRDIPGINLCPPGDAQSMAIRISKDPGLQEMPQNLPSPDELSFRSAAMEIHAHLEGLVHKSIR
jgi:glycosyltransferase involved in cell wall biosynthesis